MSQSTHNLKIKGVDATGGAFASVNARAKATGASIRAALGGALAAAGAYLSLRSVAGAVNQLGTLSDLAKKAGTSVGFLTKATTAFQVAGLNVTSESLVKAMQYMQKSTGKQGEGAFFETARELAAIPDAATRAQEAVKIFGRSGMELFPLINNGQEAVDKFIALQNVMPGVSQAAANAGDAANDALTIFGKGAQTIMLKAVGKIAGLWGEEFPGGVRAGALNAVNVVEYYAKKMFNRATYWGARIGLAFQAWGNYLFNGYSWQQAGREHQAAIDQLDNQLGAELERIEKARDDFKAHLAKLDIDDLANPFENNQGGTAGAASAGASFGTEAAKRISNALVMGNSNQMNRLAILGPEYQNEQKKQTDLLRKIADNTAKTAEESGESYPETDLGV